MNKIAIIPARAGSKGLKDKNIIDLNGKPLMAYSIEAALGSHCFDEIYVSTDSPRYARIARQYGSKIIMRGERLSNDTASTFQVVEDVLKKVVISPDYFMLLQPTSPLRDAEHVRESIRLFEQRYETFDFLVSLKESEHISALIKPLGEDGSLKYFDTDLSDYCRQNQKEYTPNGAIFIAKTKEYLKQKHFFGPKSLAYLMDEKSSVDIDTEIDYILAKVILNRMLTN